MLPRTYITVDRQTLYELVWSMPLQKVADHFDSGYYDIAKACGQLNIPLPRSGYWARNERDRTARIEPLPQSSLSETSLPVGKKRETELKRRRKNRRKIHPYIELPPYINRKELTPVVAETLKLREEGDVGDRATCSPPVAAMYGGPVSEVELNAVSYLDAIVRRVSNLDVRFEPGAMLTVSIVSQFGRQELQIREKWKQKNRPKMDLIPSGLLEATLGGHRWTEKQPDTLGQYTSDIIACIEIGLLRLEDFARKKRADRERREKREKSEAAWRRLGELVQQSKQASEARAMLDSLASSAKELAPNDRETLRWLHEIISERDPHNREFSEILSELRQD